MGDTTAPTALVEPEQLHGDRLELGDEVFHHLFRVRRLGRGDVLRLVDGAGNARRGEVTTVDRRHAEVRLGEVLPTLEPSREVELWCSFPRPERAAWLTEKATELGVARIVFLRCARSGPVPPASAIERLRRVATAAVEQCGRARLPEVLGVREWRELPMAEAGASWVLDLAWAVQEAGSESASMRAVSGTAPAESDPLASVASQVTSTEPPAAPAALPATAGPILRLLVGPEGGFAANERVELAAAGWRAWPLCARVLRLETAALAALVQLLVAPPPGGAPR